MKTHRHPWRLLAVNALNESFYQTSEDAAANTANLVRVWFKSGRIERILSFNLGSVNKALFDGTVLPAVLPFEHAP